MLKGKTGKYIAFAVSFVAVSMLVSSARSAVDQSYEKLKVLIQVLRLVQENYVEETDSNKLIYGAVKGVVRELDDFSQFMEPDTNAKVKSDTEGEFGGLGITIAARDGYITIITPLPNTPAYEAGILPNDKIIAIEGESTQDMSADDAVNKLRGKIGTKVKFTVAREPDKKDGEWLRQDYELTRAKIVPETVQSRMLDNNIGYIHIVDFSGHAVEKTGEALVELKKQGMQALVLDLRYNPGGLLTGACDISRYFLDQNKMIVYTKGRRPENYQEFRSDATAPYADLPLVVLVNGGSASASEIVSGAMQDNKRAVIIGSRTFGKASVQSIIPLLDGSGLRLTVARYYTPSGKSIHRDPKNNTGGITPDIEIKVDREAMVKIFEQYSKIYVPGKDGKPAEVKDAKPADAKDGKPAKKEENPFKPAQKKEEKPAVQDEALDRAVEILKARAAFANLNAGGKAL